MFGLFLEIRNIFEFSLSPFIVCDFSSISDYNVDKQTMHRSVFAVIGNCFDNYFIKAITKVNSILLAAETSEGILCQDAVKIPIAADA